MEIDRIHFYVADATRIQDLLIRQMGLRFLGNQVNEHTIEYLVGNSQLLFSISSPLNLASPVAKYLQHHPSGVKNISFRVRDLDLIKQRVGQMRVDILATSSPNDELKWLKVQGWGTVEYTFIQSLSRLTDSIIDCEDLIIGIDHLVLNVATGELESATIWHQNLFDFQVQQTFDIQTQTSGLTSKALISSCGKIRFNINEPSSNNSQIQCFLDLNQGAGIQHIALQTSDIFATVDRMQQQKLAFLAIDSTYYTQIQIRARMTRKSVLSDEEWQQLQHLQILIDWAEFADESVLLQIFTAPIFEAPTFFFEIIERRNQAQGFGQGNFQALFEAIEQGSRSLDVV
jgi:4-hydroxyphenylpyruvate dioxygenase